jgi:hypothetical protein
MMVCREGGTSGDRGARECIHHGRQTRKAMGSRERRPKQLLPNSTLRSSGHCHVDVGIYRAYACHCHSRGRARRTNSYSAHHGRGSVGSRLLAFCPPGCRVPTLLLAGHMRPCLPAFGSPGGAFIPGRGILPAKGLSARLKAALLARRGQVHRWHTRGARACLASGATPCHAPEAPNTTGRRGIPFRGCGSSPRGP